MRDDKPQDRAVIHDDFAALTAAELYSGAFRLAKKHGLTLLLLMLLGCVPINIADGIWSWISVNLHQPTSYEFSWLGFGFSAARGYIVLALWSAYCFAFYAMFLKHVDGQWPLGSVLSFRPRFGKIASVLFCLITAQVFLENLPVTTYGGQWLRWLAVLIWSFLWQGLLICHIVDSGEESSFVEMLVAPWRLLRACPRSWLEIGGLWLTFECFLWVLLPGLGVESVDLLDFGAGGNWPGGHVRSSLPAVLVPRPGGGGYHELSVTLLSNYDLFACLWQAYYFFLLVLTYRKSQEILWDQDQAGAKIGARLEY